MTRSLLNKSLPAINLCRIRRDQWGSGTPNPPIQKESDPTRWDKKSIWEVRYCWVGCWGWRSRGDHADDSRYSEPSKGNWAEVNISRTIRGTKHINFKGDRGRGEVCREDFEETEGRRKGERRKAREKKEQRRVSKGLYVGKDPREGSHEKFSRQSCRKMAISDAKKPCD